ncbi:DUF2304 domain-containing protein [Leifsonia sp. Root112D2]|jgi:hypothetical protein|uniref:DUF2304 domain-containing protein n=1 Tax=Leifsonia sp. Root112D2 TaxID=1736426 RepID=UPI0006FD91DB|nr:DUF2304 domain-containing protein [Leifsonia sp. Root112D2]KQV06035.1 hypothetical protein ASC63_00590 [Leifsonia sp. Root112D2]
MWIQIILVIAVVVIGLALARPSGGDNHLALRRLFMVGFIVIAVVSILFPQWLSWVAKLVGVGRGTDLLLYALVLAFLIYVSTAYRRNVQLNRKLTALARELALAEARVEDAAASTTNTPKDSTD